MNAAATLTETQETNALADELRAEHRHKCRLCGTPIYGDEAVMMDGRPRLWSADTCWSCGRGEESGFEAKVKALRDPRYQNRAERAATRFYYDCQTRARQIVETRRNSGQEDD